MKKILLLFIVAIAAINNINAQAINDIGKIVLGIKVLESSTSDTKSLKTSLESKLSKLATQAGYSSYGNNAFIISPNIIVNDVDVAEGGMKNIYVIRGELYLSIQEANNGTVFSSISFPFQGSATTQERALRNGINDISYGDVSNCFESAKRKILSYFEAKQEVIFARADTYIQNKQFDEAIACLLVIPEELFSIYTKALLKANDVYMLKQEEERRIREMAIRQSNDAVLNKAKSLIAMHNPTEALQTLWRFTVANTEQNAVCKELMSQAESMISEAELIAIQKAQREYEDNKAKEERLLSMQEKEQMHRMTTETQQLEISKMNISAETQLENQRINAIKAIACEYYRNNPTLNYY